MPRSQGTSRKGKPKKTERAAGMGRALERATHKRTKPTTHTGGMAALSGVSSVGIIDNSENEKMKSVLEMNDLADFLGQAEMSQREFASERERFVVIDSTTTAYNPSQVSWSEDIADTRFRELSLPRRPLWDESTTPEELDQSEKKSFLDWRRGVALREEELFSSVDSSGSITPFEKNIQVWRQLWRVCERSDVVIQIVDGRDISFYLSDDLRTYVCEELGKPMVVLVNKSDYLTEMQRRTWSEYLNKGGWPHFFYSAKEEQAIIDEENRLERIVDEDDDIVAEENDDSDNETDEESIPEDDVVIEESTSKPPKDTIGITNPLTRHELLDSLAQFSKSHDLPEIITYGTVGFPNVGKSSLINTLLKVSKHTHGVNRVAVASQPGKTKHFQTLALNSSVTLCDCPGLVFPSLVNARADLIAAGVFPIAQMRENDYRDVVGLILQRIPRGILNAVYGMILPEYKDGQEVDMFLYTYCKARSYWAASGNGAPDVQRAGRMIVKDYVTGRLLYCHAPPGTKDGLTFRKETVRTCVITVKKLREGLEKEGHIIQKEQDDIEEEDDSDVEPSVIDDVDILDAVGASFPQEEPKTTGSRGNAHKKIKSWGKKGRKLRDPDPYGCQREPEDMLDPKKIPMGVGVKAGKYGKKNYTRPNYAGVKAAVPFVKQTKKERRAAQNDR